MTQDIRFPFPTALAAKGQPVEDDQIITIFTGAVIPQGGAANYVPTLPWKKVRARTEVPYTEYVVEFTSDAPIENIGNGTFTQQIGLYGVIGDVTTGEKFLLGVLGMSRGGVAPQIPLPNAPDVGYAEVVCNIGLYDGLSIGGIDNNITLDEATITVRVRPIRRRSYIG